MSSQLVVDAISSREDFVRFIGELRRNLLARPDEWTNTSLGDFLEALSAWTQDMDGYYENNNLPIPETPGWRTLAEMLLAAKYYE